MIFQWELDHRFEHDHDLVAYDSKDDTLDPGKGEIVAFIRKRPMDSRYVCRFMWLGDNEYPDGQTYKNLKDARAFCKRMAPVLWIGRKT